MAVIARYPSNIENIEFYRSKIKFEAIRTLPFTLKSLDKESWNTFAERFDQASTGELSLAQLQKDIQNGRKTERYVSTGESVELFLPVSLQMTDTFQYENAQLGTVGAITETALGNGSSAIGALGVALTEGAKGISDIGKLFVGGELGALGSARLAQLAPGSLQPAIELATQAVMNPNIRAAFKSVGLRNFQFLFNLIPESAADSGNIKEIIRFFRKHAYPEDVPPGASTPLAYRYPNLFKITPMVLDLNTGKYASVGTHIKYCYCQSIAANYNPIANNTFHDDGSPIQTDLSLSFLEHKTLSRSDVVGVSPGDTPDPNYDGPGGSAGDFDGVEFGPVTPDTEPPGIRVEVVPGAQRGGNVSSFDDALGLAFTRNDV